MMLQGHSNMLHLRQVGAPTTSRCSGRPRVPQGTLPHTEASSAPGPSTPQFDCQRISLEGAAQQAVELAAPLAAAAADDISTEAETDDDEAEQDLLDQTLEDTEHATLLRQHQELEPAALVRAAAESETWEELHAAVAKAARWNPLEGSLLPGSVADPVAVGASAGEAGASTLQQSLPRLGGAEGIQAVLRRAVHLASQGKVIELTARWII